MSDREFFVGYRPVPKGVRLFYRLLAPGLLVAGVIVGLTIAGGQQSAGRGHWDPAVSEHLQGFLTADPYPVLHLANGDSVLLVRAGKATALEYVGRFVGQHVAIRGVPIERGGWTMLEVYSEDDVQGFAPEQPVAPPLPHHGGQVEMSGEIVDSKCFLGVMKPGAGKVHRACAAMCLAGGLPPMLVVTDENGDRFGYMLVTAEGGSASRQLVPDVAVPVTVRGNLEVRGALTYLRLAADGVRRLDLSNAPPSEPREPT